MEKLLLLYKLPLYIFPNYTKYKKKSILIAKKEDCILL